MSVSLFHERLIIMAKSNKNLHLTLSDRQIIQRGIENGATKASIAATLGKDKSTIGKEIKAHRKHKHICSFNPACANKDRCKHHHVCKDCADLVVFKCKRRDRSPGACNGCPKFNHCRFDKFIYSADLANKEYEADLVESREGINMTYSELKTLADIIVPLIKKGQSPYQIITSHPELNISEKTLYNYIESGVFRQFGLLDIDLRVKTRRISKKDSVKYKKREDRKFLVGAPIRISSHILTIMTTLVLSRWIPSTMGKAVRLCRPLISCLTLSCLLYTMKRRLQRLWLKA